jgi:hypothetical protein
LKSNVGAVRFATPFVELLAEVLAKLLVSLFAKLFSEPERIRCPQKQDTRRK